MKKYFIIITLLLVFALLQSCTKENGLGKKSYYGSVSGDLKGLPGTPNVDVYINNRKIASIDPGAGFVDQKIAAGEPVDLQFKRRDNNELLADTSFTAERDQKISFSLAWSDDLGIKGFLQKKAVAPDSISVQIVKNLSPKYTPAGGVDLYMCTIDPNTLEPVDTIAVYPDFKKGVLTPTVTISLGDPNNPSIYVGILKDRQTGKDILNEGLGLPLFTFGFSSIGIYCVAVVYDSSGYIDTNLIEL